MLLKTVSLCMVTFASALVVSAAFADAPAPKKHRPASHASAASADDADGAKPDDAAGAEAADSDSVPAALDRRADDMSKESPARDDGAGATDDRVTNAGRTHDRHAVKKHAKAACLREPVAIVRTGAGAHEGAHVSLTQCDGRPAPFAVAELSVLARPERADKPAQPISVLAKSKGRELAPGIRRLDVRLVQRLQAVVNHFAKPNHRPRVFLVASTTPAKGHARHAGRGIDLRIENVPTEALVKFCKRFTDTTCSASGAYVHLDIHDVGAAHSAS